VKIRASNRYKSECFRLERVQTGLAKAVHPHGALAFGGLDSLSRLLQDVPLPIATLARCRRCALLSLSTIMLQARPVDLFRKQQAPNVGKEATRKPGSTASQKFNSRPLPLLASSLGKAIECSFFTIANPKKDR